MLIDSLSLEKNTSITSDICIIGGGVAGITLGLELHKRHKGITLIESGGEEFSLEKQKLYSPETKPELYPDPTFSRLRYLGGSSNHWDNSTNTLDPIDFEKRDWVPNSGWPINYEDLAKYYPKAGYYCGVGADGYKLENWVNKLSGNNPFSESQDIKSSITKSAVTPTRFFVKNKDELENSTALTIYKNANLTDIDFDVESGIVKSITFHSTPEVKHSVTAKIFIMCLGGIENARLMLKFNEKYNNKLGNQYDNVGRYFMDHPVIRAAHLYPSDTIDKTYFKFFKSILIKDKIVHGHVKLKESALYNYRINNLRIPFVPSTKYIMSHGISSAHILSDSVSDLEVPDDFGKHIMNIVRDIDLLAEAGSQQAFDWELSDDAMQFGGFQIQAMIEQTPDRDNRITLGTERDPYNIRRINIAWRVTDEDKRLAWEGLNILAREVGKLAIGRLRVLKERESRIWGSQLAFGHHHIGTTRMSNGPKQGVVDTDQKVFGTKNFFIGGSSVFSTGGHVPPTLTIVALSIRLAKHISDRHIL